MSKLLVGKTEKGVLVFVTLGEFGYLFVYDAFIQLVLLHFLDDGKCFFGKCF